MSTQINYENNKRALIVLLGGGLGSFLEYFSFGLIGYFHLQIVNAFFPPTSNQTALLIQSFTLYGLAFIAKPFGGLLFGYLADKYSRITSLRFSIILISIPTFLIGLLPTFETIGYWSTVLVCLFRTLQGLSTGGELPSALIYIWEEAPNNRKGLYLTLLYFFSAGEIFALIAYEIIHHSTTEQFFNEYGFRIPFLLSILLAVFAIYVRNILPVTRVFQSMIDNNRVLDNPISYAFKNNFKQIICVALIFTAPCFMYSASLTWLAAYLLEIKHDSSSYDITLIDYVLFAIIALFMGWLSDKYDLYKIVVYSSIIGFFPVFLGYSIIGMITDTELLSMFQFLPVLGAGIVNMPLLIYGSKFVEDPRTRATSIGFAYNLGEALFVSSAFVVCSGLQDLHPKFGGMFVGIYASILLLLSLLAVMWSHRNPYKNNENLYQIVNMQSTRSDDNDDTDDNAVL